MRAVGRDSGSPLVILQIRHLGGALARGTADEGPAGALTEPYLLFDLGVPMVPELVPAIQAAFARPPTSWPHTSAAAPRSPSSVATRPDPGVLGRRAAAAADVKRRVDPTASSAATVRCLNPALVSLLGNVRPTE